MAETELQPVRCPFCGSKQVRLSARQSHKRPVEIFRCTRCNRHFEMAIEPETRPFPLAAAIVGALIVIAVGAIITVALGGREQDAAITASLPGPVDPNSPAPVAGSDKESQYQRGLHFWSLGEYTQALPWLKDAAGRGHREARYYLGLAYLYGRGTVQNYRLAFEQMQTAARQNELNAQHQLGLLYRDGFGVAESNRELAYTWLNIAAARGHEAAALDRDRLSTAMPMEAIARAQDATMKELANLRGADARANAAIPANPTP